ncbi:MAG TPA: hypothetical protein VM577_16860, partial [Anaerovoracaceae bacterium]|nr:hypothetical protein [Anaerovoracaceae bacterium]
NAVPVKLAEYVANSLLAFVNSQAQLETNKEKFLSWLISVKQFSQRTASDTFSRVKRADKLYQINGIPDTYYIYQLEQHNDFKSLSVDVRSQIKRATTLFSDYLQSAQ